MKLHHPWSLSRILTLDMQFTAIGGFAVGYLELITLIMCPLYCKPEDIGLASGFLGSAKQVIGTIASKLSALISRATASPKRSHYFPAVIYVAILDNRVASTLPSDVSEAALNAGLPKTSLTALLEAVSDSNSMAKIPGITEKIIIAVTDAVKTAYSESFSTVFLVSITFGGLSIIAALASVSVDDKLDNVIAAKLSGAGASQDEINREEKN